MSGALQNIPVVLIHDDERVREIVGARLGACDDIDVIASVPCMDDGAAVLRARPHAVVVLDHRAVSDASTSADDRLCGGVAPVVVLLPTVESDAVVSVIRSGGRSVVRDDFADLAGVVRLADRGVAVVDAAAMDVLVGAWTGDQANPLSARERDVLACLADGLSNAQVAAQLYVSRETVKSHVAHLLRKLDVSDRFAAVDKAARIGLLS